jgi:hypothetical protein
MTDRTPLVVTQTRPSPIIFANDTLIHSTANEVRLLNPVTLTRIDALAIPARGICALSDGTVAAFVQRSEATHCELHHIDAKRGVTVLRGPIFMAGDDTVLVPSTSADELYVTEGSDQVVLFHLGKTELEERARTKVDTSAGNLRQLTSFQDARLVAPDGAGLQVISAGKPAVRHATPGQYPVHLAPATGGRIWYSQATGTLPTQSLVLARLADKLVADARIELGPARIIHLASTPGAAAVLLVKQAGTDRVWSIAVVEETGKERWRRDIPSDVAGKSNSLDHGFVAISPKRAVLRMLDESLIGWDAVTGQPI